MFNSMNGELGRLKQADLIAAARYQGLVGEALVARASRPRRLFAAALHAAAHQMERIGTRAGREAVSVRPELPCTLSPC
jgi:hypothetical protein